MDKANNQAVRRARKGGDGTPNWWRRRTEWRIKWRIKWSIKWSIKREQEDTLAFIRDHEGYNTTKIAEALNKPFRTIDKHINALLKAGLIERRGSKKTGGCQQNMHV